MIALIVIVMLHLMSTGDYDDVTFSGSGNCDMLLIKVMI